MTEVKYRELTITQLDGMANEGDLDAIAEINRRGADRNCNDVKTVTEAEFNAAVESAAEEASVEIVKKVMSDLGDLLTRLEQFMNAEGIQNRTISEDLLREEWRRLNLHRDNLRAVTIDRH